MANDKFKQQQNLGYTWFSSPNPFKWKCSYCFSLLLRFPIKQRSDTKWSGHILLNAIIKCVILFHREEINNKCLVKLNRWAKWAPDNRKWIFCYLFDSLWNKLTAVFPRGRSKDNLQRSLGLVTLTRNNINTKWLLNTEWGKDLMIFPGKADDFLPTKQKADTTTDFDLAVC